MLNCSHPGSRFASESAWRGLLSLRDPTALNETVGPPIHEILLRSHS